MERVVDQVHPHRPPGAPAAQEIVEAVDQQVDPQHFLSGLSRMRKLFDEDLEERLYFRATA